MLLHLDLYRQVIMLTHIFFMLRPRVGQNWKLPRHPFYFAATIQLIATFITSNLVWTLKVFIPCCFFIRPIQIFKNYLFLFFPWLLLSHCQLSEIFGWIFGKINCFKHVFHLNIWFNFDRPYTSVIPCILLFDYFLLQFKLFRDFDPTFILIKHKII